MDLSKSVLNSDDTNDNDFHPAIKLRKVATENIENAAKTMVERTNKKLTQVKVGDYINVTVPAEEILQILISMKTSTKLAQKMG